MTSLTKWVPLFPMCSERKVQTADAFRFSGSLLPLLTLSEDDADRQHLLIPLCPKRKVCGRCRSFGNGHYLSGRVIGEQTKVSATS